MILRCISNPKPDKKEEPAVFDPFAMFLSADGSPTLSNALPPMKTPERIVIAPTEPNQPPPLPVESVQR